MKPDTYDNPISRCLVVDALRGGAMPLPSDQFSFLNPFAVILRYEETPYVSMSVEDMRQLVDLGYQWVRGVITA